MEPLKAFFALGLAAVLWIGIVIGSWIALWWFIRSAVRSGVLSALRRHTPEARSPRATGAIEPSQARKPAPAERSLDDDLDRVVDLASRSR